MKVIYPTKIPKGKNNKIAVFDVECWKNASDFAFGVVLWSNDLCKIIHKKVFTDLELFRSFMMDSEELKGYYIYAHNGSKYDYITLFGNYVLNNEKIMMAGNQIVYWRLNKRKFFDSYLLLRSSVEKIGKSLNLPKGETPEKFIKGQKELGINEQDIEYCIRDCHIILKALCEIKKNFKQLKPTIAGLSFAQFTNQLNKPIFVRDLDKEFIKTYRGGRTECFYVGEWKNAYYYDVNSMYPYVMSNYYFPNPSKLKKIKFNLNNNFEKILNNYEGLIYIKAFSKNKKVGALPQIINNRLAFNYGKIEGLFNICEVRNAYNLDLLDLNLIEYGIVSDPYVPPFKDLIKRQYDLRAEFKINNNTFMDMFYKFILNSLYGKFGQKNKNKSIYFDNINDLRKYCKKNNLMDSEIKKVNDYFYITIKPDTLEYKYSVYCWASYVTSLARATLLDYIVKGGIDNVLYCDTDSLILTEPIADKYVSDVELGKLKLEGIGDFIGVKAKFYRFDNKIKLKGGSIKDIQVKNGLFYIDNQILSYSDIEDMPVFISERETMVTPKTELRNSKLHNKVGQFIKLVKMFDLIDTKRKYKGINNFNEAIQII